MANLKPRPDVSVLMSVYNGEKFVTQAVESIQSQSFTDWELILVDDCSDDGTPAVLETLSVGDNRIRLVHNSQRQGLTRSLNGAIGLAIGKYLARLDADDMAVRDRFECQLALLEAEPELGVLGGFTELVDGSGKRILVSGAPLGDREIKDELLIKNFAFGHSTVMMRADVIRAVGGYNPEHYYSQDYGLWCALAERTQFGNLPRVLCTGRHTAGRISVLHRADQLACQLEISWSMIGRRIGSGAFERNCYERFWRAFHGIGCPAPEELRRLEPLWAYLEKRSTPMTRTIGGIENLAYRLLQDGKFRQGALMTGIVKRLLGRYSLYRVLISSLNSFLPRASGDNDR